MNRALVEASKAALGSIMSYVFSCLPVIRKPSGNSRDNLSDYAIFVWAGPTETSNLGCITSRSLGGWPGSFLADQGLWLINIDAQYNHGCGVILKIRAGWLA